jgi:hypothetical protein
VRGSGTVTPVNTVMPSSPTGCDSIVATAPAPSYTISSISSVVSSVLRTWMSVCTPGALASRSAAMTDVGVWITTSGLESQTTLSPQPAAPSAITRQVHSLVAAESKVVPIPA